MKSAKEIWETAKGTLQVQVNKANFETWLKDTVGVSYKGNRFVVGTPRAFAKEWLERRLHSLIRKTVIGIVGHDVEVCFEVLSSPGRAADDWDDRSQTSAAVQRRLPMPRLNPRYTFDTFVVGSSNRLAYAASVGVAEEPGRHLNPLYIYGEPGLGKTHLVHAIGNEASDSGLNVACASGEQFTNEFVSALRQKTTEDFRRKFRSPDILIIEDVQFIVGKQQTQISLFHTFDELYNSNRQVVVTGDRPPASMASLQQGLSSRLGCGLVTKVQVPDVDTLLSILRLKAKRHKVAIDDAVLHYIAQSCRGNVRELEGFLTRLIAYAKVTQRDVSLELAREVLAPLQDTGPEGARSYGLTPVTILNAVADHFSISVEAIKSRKRDSRLVLARQIAIYLVRQKTNYPLQDIGRLLGGRDHSTILRGYQRMSGLLDTDAAVQRNIHQILKNLSA